MSIGSGSWIGKVGIFSGKGIEISIPGLPTVVQDQNMRARAKRIFVAIFLLNDINLEYLYW